MTSPPRDTARPRLEARAGRHMTLWHFYFRGDDNSVAPSIAAILGAQLMILVGALLPIGLLVTGEARLSAGLIMWIGFITCLALLVPKRLVVADDGLTIVSVLGRNRRFGESCWWGRLVPWRQVVSVNLLKNNQRGWLRARLGERRYAIRLRWYGTYEVHERMPAFRRFEALARKHAQDKVGDLSKRWWRWFQ